MGLLHWFRLERRREMPATYASLKGCRVTRVDRESGKLVIEEGEQKVYERERPWDYRPRNKSNERRARLDDHNDGLSQ